MFQFGDGFDHYATPNDMSGYWDSATLTGGGFATGRFAGTQAINMTVPSTCLVYKTGVNDAVHHISIAYRFTGTLAGSTTVGAYLQFQDGSTPQCSIVFRQDGTIALTSGSTGGAVLATYSTGVLAANVWYGFEFEVVINNTTGSFKVRKNGNTSDDHSTTGINTRAGTANNYANRLQWGYANNIGPTQIDDFLWRSDASSVPFVGDIRCYTRMPASDASAQFARSPTTFTQSTVAGNNVGCVNGTARYTPFVAAYDGTFSTITISMNTAYTGNMKCSIFANAGGLPTTVLGSATPIVNAPGGSNSFTFGTPVPIIKGTQYWIGFDTDSSGGSFIATSASTGLRSSTAYASFPVASPGTFADQAPYCTIPITVTTNNCLVNETLQDGTTSYVYDSVVGHGDLYNLAPLGSTPSSIVMVTTLGFMEKSDAGARGAAMQLKSGATTVQSTATLLSTSFTYLYRNDVLNPNGNVAWTAAAVDALTFGPLVTS